MAGGNNSRRSDIRLRLHTSVWIALVKKRRSRGGRHKKGNLGNRNTICLGSLTRPRTSFSKPFNKATK
jgi:hypothetical protein